MKIKFDENGLVPMIIQDARSGAVLSLFYGNAESISKMKETGNVWRYSRSKRKLLQKGEQSGNVQKVVSVSYDCDNDALLVKASPSGPACHTGNYSCFSNQGSDEIDISVLFELLRIIDERASSQDSGSKSYTSSIIGDRSKIIEKLREECEELIDADSDANVAWEAADLLYFMLVYLRNKNVPFSQVLKELRRRRDSSK